MRNYYKEKAGEIADFVDARGKGSIAAATTSTTYVFPKILEY